MAVGALLARVRRLERSRALGSPIAAAFGSFEAFEAHCAAELAAGHLDPRDFPVIIMCLGRWEVDGTWAAWSKDNIWERGHRA